VVLAALGLLCTVTLAPHVRLYVEQERQKDDLVEEIGQREQAIADLDSRVALWQEDAFVAAQARERLHYVFPGETGYVVAPSVEGGPPDAVPGPPAAGSVAQGPWYRNLWAEFEGAGG
jgi:hypothetical protein